MRRMPASVLPALALLGASLSPACSAPGGGAGGGTASPEETPERAPLSEPTFSEGSALVIHSAGCEALLADPRDEGLRRALTLLEQRVAELPAEIPDIQVPPELIELALELLGSPFTLRVDFMGGDASMPILPDVQWTVQAGSDEHARSLAQRIGTLVAQLGLAPGPPAERPELTTVASPAGTVYFGAVGGGAFHVSLGAPRPGTPEPASFGLPAGVEPLFAFGLDMKRLQAPIEIGLAFAGQQALAVRQRLEWWGLLAEDPLAVAFVLGRGPERAVLSGWTRNWIPIVEEMGLEEPAALPETALRLVPGDATLASLSSFDPRMLLGALELVEPAERARMLAAFQELLGLDLEADVIEPLGTSYGLYLSDTTGGGGLASGVVFLAIADEARFGATLAQLARVLDERGREELDGRVRTRAFEHAGVRCLAVDLPSVPAPLQLSLALDGGYLFVTATPQALIAALDQARSGEPGLRAHRALDGLDARDLQGLFYCDTQRFVREGYGYAAGLAGLLANAARSPTDPAREPGLVLPPFHELVAGARPTVIASRIRGDDLVTEGESDRSAVVHAAAALGWAPSLTAGIPFLGMLATLVVPSVVGQLHAAQGAKARADIATIMVALEDYAIRNGGRYPSSLEALVTRDAYGKAYLDLAAIPLDPWGRPYVYELTLGRPRVLSYGADGALGGDDENHDIDSRLLRETEEEADEEQ